VRLCAQRQADRVTDANGSTEFTGVIAGGGWSAGGGSVGEWTALQVDGGVIPPRVDLAYVSPDINGDLRVDLADVAEFALDFHTPQLEFRSDFNADGIENLSDIGILAVHLGEACP
jgi:hypothetical protein